MMWALYLAAAVSILCLLFKGLCVLNERMLEKRELEGYTMQLTGEVAGSQRERKRSMAVILETSPWLRSKYDYNVYRAVVRYQVNDVIYEIRSCEDELVLPIPGRRAMVFADRQNPANARVWTRKKYKKRLKIQRRDEEYIYCSSGFKKEIPIPLYLAEEGAVPGRYLVERYGYYHLFQPEDERGRSLKGFVKELLAGMSGDPLYEEKKNEWNRES